MPDITVTDHYPYCEAASGDTVHFEYNGQRFYVECWSTRHGSGVDIYDVRHQAVEPFQGADREEFEEQIRAFLVALAEAEDARAVPEARQEARVAALEGFNSREAGFGKG